MDGVAPIFELAVFYCIIAAIGIPANLVLIGVMLRRRCGLSRCITVYLLSMAVTDLLVIITCIILLRIFPMIYSSNVLTIVPWCSVNISVAYAVRDCSVWVTVMFTFDRFVAICCQKLKTKYCTERTAALVIGIVIAVYCFKNILLYFVFEPPQENGPTTCIIKKAYYTSAGWIAYDWIDSILIPCLPMVLILLFNFITIRYIVRAIKIRRRLQSGGNSERQNDPETDNRRKSVVLLLSISGIFVLFWIISLITFLYVRIANLSYFSGSNYSESVFPLEESGHVLQFLCSCVNPFIYAGTQSKIRDEIKLAFKYPLTLFIKIAK